jgi:2-oxoglutarate dehydrogenase complex dehydrogenase (E1) component-like enzyme
MARSDATSSDVAQSADKVVFVGDAEEACRYIAAIAWPFENAHHRDEWAVTMLNRPELLASEIDRAHERMGSAIERIREFRG